MASRFLFDRRGPRDHWLRLWGDLVCRGARSQLRLCAPLQDGPAVRHGNRLVARAGLGLTLAVLLALAAALASDLHKPARADPLAQPCGEAGCESAASPIAPLKSQAPGQAGGTPGNFDFYVLALSWSPSFCEAADPERAGAQCEPGAGLGFVVHGLWPQDEYGFPTNCRPAARFPSRMALETAKRIYPSERLARHEWQRHGTCSGKSPTDYFADVPRARCHCRAAAIRRSQRKTNLGANRHPARFHCVEPALAPRNARRCVQWLRAARGPDLLHEGSPRISRLPGDCPRRMQDAGGLGPSRLVTGSAGAVGARIRASARPGTLRRRSTSAQRPPLRERADIPRSGAARR